MIAMVRGEVVERVLDHVTLMCGGAYIKLSAAGVELGATAAGPTIRITPALIDLGNGALQITGG